MPLIQEKVNQAIEILKEQNTDMWLTFVRETSGVRDPALDFLIGENDLTWPSALILTRKGEKIAIIGNLEKDALERMDVFDEILGYDTAVSELLKETITRLNPTQIAVNTSRNNVHADGLTHAMYEFLKEYLAGTPFADRLVSAEPVISAMRGRKTPHRAGASAQSRRDHRRDIQKDICPHKSRHDRDRSRRIYAKTCARKQCGAGMACRKLSRRQQRTQLPRGAQRPNRHQNRTRTSHPL